MEKKGLRGKGMGVTRARSFEEETSSTVQEQLARLKLAERLIPFTGKRVLDFGCGTGYNCYYLATRDEPGEVVGIDLLAECIEHCRQHYALPNVTYHVQDCLEFNPALGLFDAVISCEVLEHVTDQALFLANVEKYLAPGGSAFISTPNKGVFSLSKDDSFLNNTHLRELFHDEFRELITAVFPAAEFYSQVHKGDWHQAYINSLCVSNYIHVLRNQCFRNRALARLFSTMARALYLPLRYAASLPDVRSRTHADFEFVPGRHDQAAWFITVARKAGSST